MVQRRLRRKGGCFMVKIQQIKLPVSHTKEDLENKIKKLLKISSSDLISWTIRRQSLDARKKPELFFVYTIEAEVKKEKQILKRVNNKNIMSTTPVKFSYLKTGNTVSQRPVIVGSGPAGLFCAYYLIQAGLKPLIIERGEAVENRLKTVEKFWNTGTLNTESNVQFGEGGAGTFSDGKLNTLVKDTKGRNQEVLKIFVKFGAPEEILYQQKPHLGTDALVGIVKNMRNYIKDAGGEFLFSTKMTDIHIKNKEVKAITVNETEKLETDCLVLAIGHSARDTFALLKDKKLPMEAKAFAVGLRAEHPQTMINLYQYGEEKSQYLGAASYKLTHKCKNNRGVYSFCMCPGGFVVNASSEEKKLAVNGMSYQDRGSDNANSALIVTVTPEDFPGTDVLRGMEFQRKLEEKAYELGNGNIPLQLYGDFVENKTSKTFGSILPCMKGNYSFANLRTLLPEELNTALIEGIEAFEKTIPGFSRADAILSGIESRTSSPIRIVRNETFESEIHGIYPCGEGAGYAGGITSAAMDGLKVGEAIMKKIINFS